MIIEKFNSIDFIIKQISIIADKYDIQKIILFGSRARGDNSYTSDIDLAVYTNDSKAKTFFILDLEEINTLLKFDVVIVNNNISKNLLRQIKKDGVVIYEQK